jgi:predicted hydrocarbon binding protein
MSKPIATSKGTILKSLLKFIDEEFSPAEREKISQRLTPDVAELMQGRVLVSQPVPEAALNRITDAAAAVKGEDIESFGRRAGRAELQDAIGIYRLVFAVMTPNALIGKASSLWRQVHNTGSMAVTDKSDVHARIELSDFPSERAHCARLAGWFHGLADMTRVKNVRIEHDVCKARGGKNCSWTLRWEK